MNINKFEEFQSKTEKNDFDLKYMAIGFGGEVGEVLNEIKKYERDDNSILTESRRQKIILELGDTLWYLQGICRRINTSIEDVINSNIIKLNNKNKIL